jgi:MurNAc alpha-1-phosphate uridylyltransferase
MVEISVLVFAAGLGTRMGALTSDRPKPLVEVLGKPLIDHALALVDEINTSHVVVNAHHKHEMLSAHLGDMGVKISSELPDVLETGGGLKAALPMLQTNPVITLNSDAIWVGPNPLKGLINHWDCSRMDGLLLCVPPEQKNGHKGLGDFSMDAQGILCRQGNLVYSGAQIIKTELLDQIDDKVFSLNRLWDIMLKNNTLFGLFYSGLWCDVGTPEGIIEAESMILKEKLNDL